MTLLAPALSFASQTGIPGYSQNATGIGSCHECHDVDTSAPANTLSITGNNTALVGSVNSYTVKLLAPYGQNANYGGFDISASAGLLIPADAETTIINSELVHSDRKVTTNTGSSYDVQWNFDWQASASAGTATFFACGLPVDGDGRVRRKDHHGSNDGRVSCTTFDVLVQQAPNAIAGNNQTVTEGNAVILDGSSSTDDGSMSYLWEQLSGLPATPLNNAGTAIANFTAPAVADNATEELVFRLTVTDNDGLTNTDIVSVFVQDVLVSNQPPVADAGAIQSVNENTLVTLDASASSDDGSIASYLWEQAGGINSVVLNPANPVDPAKAEFIAPAVDSSGDVLTFQLTVTDDTGLTATSTVDVTVNDVDTPPTAKITDASGVVISAISNNGVVTLYGNFSSDPDGPIAAYSWSQTAGLPITNPGSANQSSFSFTAPDDPGNSIDIQLSVTGDKGLLQNSVTATLILNNLPPVVDAGVNQTVTEGTTINLHGTVTDANNNLSSVQWRQINCGVSCIMQPIDIALPLINNDAHMSILSPSVTADNSGLLLEFELVASDVDGLSAISIVQVSINDNGISHFPPEAIPFTSFNGQPMAISVENADLNNSWVISNLQLEDDSSVSDPVNRPLSFPYDLTNLEITLSAPGSVLVTLYFPEAVAEDFDLYQYLSSYNWVNASSAKDFDDLDFSSTTGWGEITEEAEFSADRRSVSFWLTDGGPSDQNPANLVVSAQVGVGENPLSNASQPGATGRLSPSSLLLIGLAMCLLRASRRFMSVA
ncbi:MAG: hypothetical protein OEZ15_10575 [Gammaproteobacteria bacterium]|nr:hypothetical protein [Gammaproteobacteria bacterium]